MKIALVIFITLPGGLCAVITQGSDPRAVARLLTDWQPDASIIINIADCRACCWHCLRAALPCGRADQGLCATSGITGYSRC